jgi:hypothetical protein
MARFAGRKARTGREHGSSLSGANAKYMCTKTSKNPRDALKLSRVKILPVAVFTGLTPNVLVSNPDIA